MQDNLTLIEKIKVNFRHIIAPLDELKEIGNQYNSILDIGCGLGVFLELFQNKCLKGYEISEQTVLKARELLRARNREDVELELFDGNIQSLLDIDQFGVIFLNDVLHHINPSDQKTFLKDLHNRMRNGASLVLKDIDAQSFLSIFNKIHDLIINKEISHERSMIECSEWLTEMGFSITKVIKIRKFVYPHFILVCQKIKSS
jgi:SAM-dependent methyltransferase